MLKLQYFNNLHFTKDTCITKVSITVTALHILGKGFLLDLNAAHYAGNIEYNLELSFFRNMLEAMTQLH